ncbi:hypothetical protein BDV96DRAFT_686754 [Lophiotrema nucula]|uniref:Uncharacterized protein n=1 Tax=Lophiotrema nucula TaxID=690887 RepID=A0A6A5ZCB9_9PLEO|nr:hypothetical protein BDV96DRAFT_686754 [Lophiotrema nucula]
MAAQEVSNGHALSDGQRPATNSQSPGASLEDLDLKVLRLSTTASDYPLRNEECSTYHIYHKHEQHRCISATIDPAKERWHGPTPKECKEKRQRRKLREEQKKEGLTTVATSASEADDGSFYLHTPYLAFHNPPRVLYMGSTKHCEPAVLIHDSLCWRKWKLQLGPSIAKPGVLDPRGVVSWRHNGGDSKARKEDHTKLKGYKVRTWRLWGETGKDFVHGIKTTRETGVGADPDVLEDETQAQKDAVKADEVVWLKWTSPFSLNTRRYHFQYAGIDFYWKGTGTVKETRTCGFFVHFNHLKFVARLPIKSAELEAKADSEVEVCLGKYTCSVAKKKSGTLELFDGAILSLMSEHMSEILPGRSIREESNGDGDSDDTTSVHEFTAVKRTPLYQVIVATAMCMIIGEKQKRDTIRSIIEAAASEGSAGS